MTTGRKWVLVKYVSDLIREEPRNVGVFLSEGDSFRSRFIGQRDDGSIDGRRAHGLNSIDTYKMWVDHFRKMAETDPTLSGFTRRPGDNYFVSTAACRVFGDQSLDLSDHVDALFASLVAEEREAVETLRERVEGVFSDLELEVEPDPVFDLEVDGIRDFVKFDYLFNNSRPHLMQRVNLEIEDARAWDRVHAASYGYDLFARDHGHGMESASFVTLVTTGIHQSRQQLDQLRVLERRSDVVDFRSKDAAAENLQNLLFQRSPGRRLVRSATTKALNAAPDSSEPSDHP